MILLSVDESVSVNLDGNCSGGTRQFGFRFCGHVFSKVSNLVMVPESEVSL